MRVAGVDSCKGGWLVVIADASGPLRILDTSVCKSFRDVVERTKQCAATGVDIPIGLMDDDARKADVEARHILSPVRASSVYPSPIRPVLQAGSYAEACELSMNARGKKLSQQSYAIMPKIREVDKA